MDIIIQSLGFKASNALESYIREKLNTLKTDKIVRANVTLYKGPDSTPENNYCEIRLEVPGQDHFAKKVSPHFEPAVNECVDVLQAQIVKIRGRKEDGNRHQDKTNIQDVLMQQDSDNNEDVELEDVVK
ncbi:HPF/RaiA family ribosome-associated protein [Chitinophaga sancti]|uniref:HPF/RaiA family ribosome-associated protein n=1 Tax=Chitinophaga sancti TaxID=1004 RepID=A0A1K1RQ35_9BACT|nr:HPF/RaiA family ribosome-associated protein [Chitinophaga sancti]WQD62561.1 HPF/RaiA family ribosome-associated protein [Chitinophaga sancti]WQG91870.1 HPF/RaiA family ribosome-associated protein [Chitinophaga sancti]SFW73900.1 Sigma 54 modulation protein / S30EA ribosomal protein [Chitinophaga sancti]